MAFLASGFFTDLKTASQWAKWTVGIIKKNNLIAHNIKYLSVHFIKLEINLSGWHNHCFLYA
jgi:hypothetical protein